MPKETETTGLKVVPTNAQATSAESLVKFGPVIIYTYEWRDRQRKHAQSQYFASLLGAKQLVFNGVNVQFQRPTLNHLHAFNFLSYAG